MLFLLSAVIGFDQADGAQIHGLTTAGWIFISAAWISIIGLAVFCYRKVIMKSEQKRRATP
jgi:hypothetical protein